MKHPIVIAGCAAIVASFVGCTTTTKDYDPYQEPQSTRAMGTVSHAECVAALKACVSDAMVDPSFVRFLEKYRKDHPDEEVPLMQVGKIANKTDDPNFQVQLLTDELCTSLRKAGKVDITLAAGTDAKSSMGEARDLSKDANFDQSTVIKKGTLVAPSLSMEGAILYNRVKDGDTTVRVYSFNMKIADLVTGREIWSLNKPVGTVKSTSFLGW